jgi:hypothetical protein
MIILIQLRLVFMEDGGGEMGGGGADHDQVSARTIR